MKKTLKKAVLAAILATVLTGCVDATTKLKDGTTPIITIGNSTITKSNGYAALKQSVGSYTVVTNAINYIANTEIPTTDDIQSQAEQSLESYKNLYGDSFTEYLETLNMTEEEFVNNTLISSIKTSQLLTKYIESNYDTLCEQYTPMKFNYIVADSQETADALISKISDLTDDDLTNYIKTAKLTLNQNSILCQNLSSDIYDSDFISTLAEADSNKWVSIQKDSQYYVIYKTDITDNDKETIQNFFLTSTDMNSIIKAEYLKQYNFEIYDIDLYNSVSATLPTLFSD